MSPAIARPSVAAPVVALHVDEAARVARVWRREGGGGLAATDTEVAFVPSVRCRDAPDATRFVEMATVTELAGAGFARRLTPRPGHTLTDIVSADSGQILDRVDPLPAQLLGALGERYGAGLGYGDFSVAAVEVLFAQGDPKRHGHDPAGGANWIVAAAVATPTSIRSFTGATSTEIARAIEFELRRTDPDVVVGYELDAMLEHMSAANTAFAPGRGPFDIASLTTPDRRSWQAGGRELVDLAHVEEKLHRRTTSLPEFAARFGIDAPALPPARLVGRLVAEGAADTRDLRELAESRARASLLLAAHVIPTFLEICQHVAVPLGLATRLGPGELADLALVTEYLRRGQAIPVPPRKVDFAAPRPAIYVEGSLETFEVDIESAYPSTMLRQRIESRSDRLGVSLALLCSLVKARDVAKRDAANSSLPTDIRQGARARSDGLKLLANAFYGLLGADRLHFADASAAGAVTLEIDRVMDRLVDALDRHGVETVQAVTDGLEARAKDPSVDIRAAVEAARTEASPGYRLRVGAPRSIVISRALGSTSRVYLDDIGAVIAKGRVAKGGALPPAPRLAWELTLGKVLRHELDALRPAREIIAKLRGGQIPAHELAMQGIADAPPPRGDDDDDERFSWWQAAQVAVRHARARGLEVAVGAQIQWVVARTADADGTKWYERARLLDVGAAPDAAYYEGVLARHVRALARATGAAACEAALAAPQSAVEADWSERRVAHPPAGPRWVAWDAAPRMRSTASFSARSAGMTPGSTHRYLLGSRGPKPESAAELLTRCRTGSLFLVPDGTLTPSDRRRVLDVLEEIVSTCGGTARAVGRGRVDGADALVVAQGLLGVPDLASLHDAYAAVAEELARAVRKKLRLPHRILDLSVYAPLALAVVQEPALAATTSCTGVLQQAVEASRTLVEWRRVPTSRPSRAPVTTAPAVAGARAPCAEQIFGTLASGEGVRDALIRKAVHERVVRLGHDAHDVARELDDAGLRRSQRRKFLRVLSDGEVRLRSPATTAPCADPALAAVCDPSGCHHAGHAAQVRGAVFEEFAARSREALRRAVIETPLERGRPRVVSASVRSGKTTTAAELTIAELRAGRAVLYTVNTHAACEMFLSYVQRLGLPDGITAVHVDGRDDSRNCLKPSRTCGDCPHGVYVPASGRRALAPGAVKARRRAGLLTRERLTARTRKSGLCVPSMGRAIAPVAQLVVATHQAFLNETKRRELFAHVDTVIIDEGDLIADGLAKVHVALPLFGVREAGGEIMRPQEGGPECTQRCAECTLVGLANSSSDAGGIEAYRTALATLRSGAHADVGDALDLDALGDAVEALALVEGAAGDTGSPKDKMLRLGRELLLTAHHPAIGEVPGRGPIDVDPHKPVPVAITVDRCITGRVSDKATGDAAVDAMVLLARLVDDAAVATGHLVVDAWVRTDPAPWVPHCGLALNYIDRASARSLGAFIERRRALFLSASFIDPAASMALAGIDPARADVTDATVDLHAGVHVLLHSVGVGAHKAAASPTRFSNSDIAALLEKTAARHLALGARGPLRALVFATSKDASAALAKTLGQSKGLRVERVGADGVTTNVGAIERRGSPERVVAEVVVEHLRSAESRAVDRDFDLVVVVGSGRPALTAMQRLADTLAVDAGRPVDAADLAHESRLRAITQAALRHAGLGHHPRAVLILADLTPADLPGYVAARTTSTTRLFRRDLHGVPRPAHQRAAIAQAIVSVLNGRRPAATTWIDDVAVESAPTSPRALGAAQRALTRLLVASAMELPARKTAARSADRAWSVLVSWDLVRALVAGSLPVVVRPRGDGSIVPRTSTGQHTENTQQTPNHQAQ